MLLNVSRIFCLVVSIASITMMAYSKNIQPWQIGVYACFLNIPAMMVLFPRQVSALFFGGDSVEDADRPPTESAGARQIRLPQIAVWGWVLLIVLLAVNHLLRR